MPLILTIAGLILFCLAGLNIRAPRFAPEWFAFACITAALMWGVLTNVPS